MNDGSILQAQSEQTRQDRLMNDIVREAARLLEEAGQQLRTTINTTMDRNTIRGTVMAAGQDVEKAGHLLLAATRGL